MARKLLDTVKQRVMGAGAELGARAASRALDALQTASRVRHEAPVRLKAAARRVPIVGNRLGSEDAPKAKANAPAKVAEVKAAPAREAKRAERKAAQKPRAVENTPIEFTPPGGNRDYFKGRKVVVAGGRKTLPAAAAKQLRAKAKPNAFKAKRGQKKHH